jgi:hypothetical protein
MEPKLIDFANAFKGADKYNADTAIARTDVTAMMTDYIKTHELQCPENRKNFRLDAKMARLFDVEEGKISNWFEMQKFLAKTMNSKKKADVENDTVDVGNTSMADAMAEPGVTTVQQTSKPDTKTGKRIKRV